MWGDALSPISLGGGARGDPQSLRGQYRRGARLGPRGAPVPTRTHGTGGAGAASATEPLYRAPPAPAGPIPVPVAMAVPIPAAWALQGSRRAQAADPIPCPSPRYRRAPKVPALSVLLSCRRFFFQEDTSWSDWETLLKRSL